MLIGRPASRTLWILLASMVLSLVPVVPVVAAEGGQVTGWLDVAEGGFESIRVAGWSADPDLPDTSAGVHVYVDGNFTTGGPAELKRPDVDRVTGLGEFHGFEFEFAATAGTRRVCVYGIDRTGDPNKLVDCETVTVDGPTPPPPGSAPKGWLDSIEVTDTGVEVRGWALDPDTTESIGVHVYVDGRFHSGFKADQFRPDVGTAFGLGDYHGFSETLQIDSGWRTVCFYGIDKTGDKNAQIDCGGEHLVSRFTTYHSCCQPRVHNIHVMADEVDGLVVDPGDVFDLNQRIGPRTEAKGYVPAPILLNGESYCCDHPLNIGGGTSQFGTTLYAAIFWAGYDEIDHKPHSRYISRYPLGIEATLGYPSPNVVFRNDTTFPVRIRTRYTSTSLTVELWGYNSDRTVIGSHRSGRTSVWVGNTGKLDARRVSASVSGSATYSDGGFVRVTRTLTTQEGSTSETWTHQYIGD